MKLIWMSDLHFAVTGDVPGHDPRARLDAAIDHVNRLHDDADFCILSGDLVDEPGEADYPALRQNLDRLSMPYLPMMGNHDNRNLFRAALPLPEGTMAQFVQFALPTDAGLILCLDTTTPGTDEGYFCEDRQTWLKGQLEAAGVTPVYIFAHHPPMPLDMPLMDSIRLTNGDALLDVLAQYDCVRHCFFAHVHRPITGTIRGIPFAVMRSVLLQAPLPRPPLASWDEFIPRREPPAIGVLTLSGGDVLLHYEEFCSAEFGAPSS